MAGTVRDFIKGVGSQGLDYQQAQDAFEARYGVPITAFKGKLDTPLKEIAAVRDAAKAMAAPFRVAEQAATRPAGPTIGALPGKPDFSGLTPEEKTRQKQALKPGQETPEDTGTMQGEAADYLPTETEYEGELAWSPGKRLVGVGLGAGEAIKTPLDTTRAGQEAAYKERKERLEKMPWQERTLTDVSDFISGVPVLAAELALPKYLKPGETEMSQGKALGKTLAEGMTGGSLATFYTPEEGFGALGQALQDRPLSTLADAVPALGALKRIGKAGVVAKAGKAVSETAPIAKAIAAFDKVAEAGKAKFPGMDERIIKAKQFLLDGLAQGSESARRIVEQIALDPDAAISEMGQIVERLARGIEKGETRLPEELTPRTPPEPSPGGGPPVSGVRSPIDRLGGEANVPVPGQQVDYVVSGGQVIPQRSVQAPNATYAEAARGVDLMGARAGDTAFHQDMGRLAENLAKVTGKSVEEVAPAIRSRLFAALEEGNSALLLEPTVRKQVLNQIASDLGISGQTRARGVRDWVVREFGMTDRSLLKQINDTLQTSGKTGDIPTFNLNGRVINVGEILQGIRVRDKGQRAVAAQQALASYIADQTQSRMKAGIEAQMSWAEDPTLGRQAADAKRAAVQQLRDKVEGAEPGSEVNLPDGTKAHIHPNGTVFLDKAGKLSGVAARLIDKITTGEDVPLFVPDKGFNPKVLAAELRTTATGPLADARNRAADKLDRYQKLDSDLLGVQGYADPVTKSALEWHAKAQRIMDDPLISSWTKAMKGNLTARNLVSAINNTMSNWILQTLRRGDPTVPLQAAKVGAEWAMWKDGKLQTPERSQMFRAIESTGVLDSDALMIDIGMAANPSAFNKASEVVYRAGDQLGKLEETVTNYKTAQGWLDDLVPQTGLPGKSGTYVDLQVSPRQTVRLSKDSYGDVVLSDPRSRADVGRKLDSDEVARVLAKAAALPAEQIMFNYADVSNLGKWLKTAPIVGIASPFVTWSLKAIDLPGKPGLGYRTIARPFDVARTNSPKILAKQAASDLFMAARKNAIINSTQAMLREQKNSELNTTLRYMPHEARMGLVVPMSDPSYISTLAFGNWNYLAVSEKLLRVAINAVSEDAGDTFNLYPMQTDKNGEPSGVDFDLAGLKPEEVQRYMKARRTLQLAESGQISSISDVLDLIGTAGSPLLDTVTAINEAGRAGKTVSWGDAWRMLSGPVLGGNYAKIIDSLAGAAVDPAVTANIDPMYREMLEPLTNRHFSMNEDPMVSEPYVRWVVRKFSGLGWRTKDASKVLDPKTVGSTFNKLQAEWMSSTRVKERIKNAETMYIEAERVGNMGAMNQAKRQIQEAELIKAVIESEIEMMAARYNDTLESLGRPRVPELDDLGSPAPEESED